MTTITTRSGKGSPLTNDEVDANFTNLNDDKIEASGDSMTGNLSFGDNDKAIFGAGSDLSIYHDGSSRIANSTGNLIISDTDGDIYIQAKAGENSIRANNDGSVLVYFDNAEKMSTTSTGIDVTGTVTADGLTVAKGSNGTYATLSGDDAGGGRGLAFTSSSVSGSVGARHTLNALSALGEVALQTNSKDRLNISSGGDISFYEDTGTTAKLFWDASTERLGIGATSLTHTLHVTGSSNEMGLFKRSAAGNSEVKIDTTTSGDAKLTFANDGTAAFTMGRDNSDSSFRIASGGTLGSNDRLVINSSGNVGIGTSPAQKLHVVGTTRPALIGSDNATNIVKLYNSATGSGVYNGLDLLVNSTSGSYINTYGMPLIFGTSASNGTDATERMRIDSSGNVGIGTSSPSSILTAVSGASADETVLTVANDYSTADAAGDASGLMFQLYRSYASSLNDAAFIKAEKEQAWDASGDRDSALTFGTRSGGTEPTERMRIDSSGNLLVGKTSADFGATAGVEIRGDGRVATGRAGESAVFNRLTSDGNIVLFRKDGTTVGSIGVSASDNFYIGATSANHTGLSFSDNNIVPMVALSNSDATTDLGASAVRFKDLYLSGGVYLGGTGSANHLDDYEEGTWTPAPTSGTLNAGATGSYVKIGNLVHVQGQLSFSANGTTNRIDGLPFRPRIEATLSSARQRFLIYSDSTTAIYGYCQDVNNALHFQNEDRTAHDFDTADGVYTFAFTYET